MVRQQPSYKREFMPKAVDWGLLQSSLETCINELWSMFEMTSFKASSVRLHFVWMLSRRDAMRHCVLGLTVFVIGYLATCALRGENHAATNSPAHEEITVLRPVPAILNEETHPAVNAIETQIKGKPGTPFQFRRAQFIDETHGWAMTLYLSNARRWDNLGEAVSGTRGRRSIYGVQFCR